MNFSFSKKLLIAFALAFSPTIIFASAVNWCEACPGNMLHHCETNANGNPHTWTKKSGPFGWTSPDGLPFRSLLCNTSGTAKYKITTICLPPRECESQIILQTGSASCGSGSGPN